jgi:hypothetical protein
MCDTIPQKKLKKGLTNGQPYDIIKTQRGTTPSNESEDFTMIDYNITAQEAADYIADMLEMAGDDLFPTEEEMAEMAEFYGEN